MKRPGSGVRDHVLSRSSYASPIGEILLVASERGLCGLVFADPRGRRWLAGHIARRFPGRQVVEETSPAIAAARAWLDRYFADPRSAAPEAVPLDLRGAPFELRVWRALLEVRCGSTATYGAIAKAVGAPTAARAVGAANGANPVSLIVPCHRIIGANGSLTGYGGGMRRKEWLLHHEGARLI